MQDIIGNKGFRIGAVLLIAGIIALGIGFKDWVSLTRNVTDFNQMNVAECKTDMYVSGQVNESLGCYCEEDHKKNGVVTSTSRYYLVTCGENQDTLIGVKVEENEFDTYDALYDRTMAFYSEETDSIEPLGKITGKLRRCDNELEGYLKEYLGEELGDAYVPYYIEEVTIEDSKFMMMTGGVVGGAGLIIIILFFIALAQARRPVSRNTRQEEFISENNETFENE